MDGSMRIATFNINGIKARLPRLLEWLDETRPDVACLQEIKTSDETFPIKDIEDAGYGAIWHGQKGFNGVAILSQTPLSDGGTRDWCAREDCRHVAADIGSKVELHNFYVPAGGDE